MRSAKLVISLSLITSAFWGTLFGVLGYLFRQNVAAILSSDPAVTAEIVSISGFLWSSYGVMSIGMQCLGILDGQGRANESQLCFYFGMLLTTIPLSFISFLFTDFGLVGLWASILAGTSVSAGFGFYLLFNSDWLAILESATSRLDLSREGKDIELVSS